MEQLTDGDTSLLVGEEIVDVLIEYSAQLARYGTGDRVDVLVIGSDGIEVMALVRVGVEATMWVEPSTSELPEPDNAELAVRLRAEMVRRHPAWMDEPDPLEDPEVIADAESWARRHRA
jgi:hypothetical protein